MSEQPTVFAVAAHPDDIEFNMAGTLILLARAGFAPHTMNISRSNLDSNTLPEDDIKQMRLAEARASAAVIGAVHHPPIADDLMIFYDDKLLRRMAAVVREIRRTIVLLPSLNDYMEDHTNTARLTITACFSRAMPRYTSDPPREPTEQDVYLYHAQPHLNRDGMRTLVVPELYVDITDVMDTKIKMLGCHESQRQWLGETQGLDDYLESMCTTSAELGRMSGAAGVEVCRGIPPA